jgi:hypothetical protein
LPLNCETKFFTQCPESCWAKQLERIQQELESTLFGITHQGSERIVAEHERRLAEIAALRAQDGSNAQQVDQLIAPSAAVREAQLSQLRAPALPIRLHRYTLPLPPPRRAEAF